MICVSALLRLPRRVIRAGRLQPPSGYRRLLSIKLMMLFRQTGRVDHRQLGGQRRFKLDRHRGFILERVAERADITMPELADKLASATGTRADPSSLSRWLIRNGYRFKKNTAGQRTRQARHPPGAPRMG